MIIRTLALCAVAAFSAFTSTASHAANWQPGQDGQSITLPVKSYSLSAVTFRCNGATLEVVLTYGANAPKKYIAIFGGDGGSDVVLRWKSTVASGGAKGYALDPTSSAKLLRALKAGKSSVCRPEGVHQVTPTQPALDGAALGQAALPRYLQAVGESDALRGSTAL